MRAAAGGTDGDILSQYPGTALTRMENCRERAASLVEEQLSGVWEDVRGLLLWAAGLRDLRDVPPGGGCQLLESSRPIACKCLVLVW